MHILINNCKIFFEVYGSKLQVFPDRIAEKPTLIILHGGHGMVDHTIYVDFWSRFSDIAQVILIDQRGCGRSDGNNPAEWNLEHWAEDLHQFCQTLGISKPILAGISMGGHVLCEYIRNYANEAGAFIFCNTEAQFILEDACTVMERKAGKEVAEILRKQFTAPTPTIQKEYQQKCVPHYGKRGYTREEVLRCHQHPEVFAHYCENEMLKFNYMNELYKIKAPTLLMVGEKSLLHPPIRALKMAEKISNGLTQIHIFKEAGAPVYNDAPKEAEQVVRNFILNFVKTA